MDRKVLMVDGSEVPDGGPYYLLQVDYNGELSRAELVFYDPRRSRILRLIDGTGHRPYFYTDVPVDKVREMLRNRRDFKGAYEVKLRNLLTDEEVYMTKIVASDPLAVGGRENSLRHMFQNHWESKIKYHLCYLYDLQLIPGIPYRVEGSSLREDNTLLDRDVEESILETLLEKVDVGGDTEYLDTLSDWAKVLSYPIIDIPRVAVDIEVKARSPHTLPDPSKAEEPVIAISAVSSTGLKKVFLLKRANINQGESPDILRDVELEYFDDEAELLSKVFEVMSSYPLVITFNGDAFDLPYLKNRAVRLGINSDRIPISIKRDYSTVRPGVHLDLYKFFSNRAIRVYAFGNKYAQENLDTIAEALLGRGKIGIRDISTADYLTLAAYCFNDSLITLELTKFNDNLVMRLLLLLMRITRLPIEDVSRLGVSKWVQNLFYFEHRKRGYLIPNQEDVRRLKGEAMSRAVIKGKKYMGAKVLEPVPGLHFNVVVLDFASLYPSIIKTWNLSYETVNCPHSECRSNKVPGLPHWVCSKRRGLISMHIGALRDLRVFWFKPKSKDPGLSKDLRASYKVIQSAMKVILNASYGVFGSENFALYCPPMAESTTAIGRHYIDKTVEKARSMGLQILYGDTDSLFLKNPSEEQVQELISWADRELKIDLEVDKVYTYVSLSRRKKNYVGLLSDGSFDIKGVKGKKRDTPDFLKDAFKEALEILRRIKSDKDLPKVKGELKDLIQRTHRLLKERRIPLDKIALKAQLGKELDKYVKTTPPHVKAARMLVKRGVPVRKGDTIAYVKVRGGKEYMPVRLARMDEVDVDKYVEHMKTIFEQVLDAFGLDFDELVGYSSKSLGAWLRQP